MPEEEGVELYDYLKVIGKRKWLIIVGTIACVLTAGLVSLRLPKVYEATLDLKIGKVWNSSIEEPGLVALFLAFFLFQSFCKKILLRIVVI